MMMRFMPVMVLLLLTVVFGFLLSRPEKDTIASTQTYPLPVVVLTDMQGQAGTVKSNGQWQLVNFFASWCIPCVLEHPQLVALQKEGIAITGIAYKDKKVMVEAMLKERGNPYAKVLLDDEGRSSVPFGISGVPESFLVNADGQVVWHYAGPMMEAQVGDMKEVMDAHR